MIQFFKHTCELFEAHTDYNIFYTSIQEAIRESFFFQIFSRSHTFAEEVEDNNLVHKTLLLSMLFGLKFAKKHSSLSEKLDLITNLISTPIIRSHIPKIESLISDVLMDNIIIHYLSTQIKHASNENKRDIILEIVNNSDFTFQNIHYELVWKPKKRLNLISMEEIFKSIDLHNELKRRYLFSVNNYGTVSLFCNISFSNPIYQDKKIKTNIFLEKI